MHVLVYITLGLLGLYIFLRPRKRNGTPIPGPNGWPYFGVGFDITPQNARIKFAEYAQTYGDIFQIKMFGNNIVFLNSSDLIRTAFNAEPYKRSMSDRAATFYGDNILCGSQDSGFMERVYGNRDPFCQRTGPSRHGELRKGFTRALDVHGEGRKQFEAMIHTELARVIGEIDAHHGETFDFHLIVRNFVCNLRGRGVTPVEADLFWNYVRAEDFLLNPKVDVTMRGFYALKMVPSEYRHRYEQMVVDKKAIIKLMVEEPKATYKEGVTRGMVDYMIREQRQVRQNLQDKDAILFNDETITCTVLQTLSAGILTSFCHLTTMFLILLNHPGCQADVQAEIDTVIGRHRLPGLDDKPHCPLVEAVAMETHRYAPVLPENLPHVCEADVEFEGYHIPEGSSIMPNVWHVHHDLKTWGDPWTFRPERFLTDDGDVIPHDHPLRKCWLPFGTGRRQCIGESLARSRVFLFLTTLLQRWTFRPPPGVRVPCDPRAGSFEANLFVYPRPFSCIAVPRGSTVDESCP